MSKTMFPLIEHNVGEVTYQHCLVEFLPREVIIAAAERNLYVDRYHEINLCVYWNKRISGKYEFDNKYSFYITDGRIVSDILNSLGRFSDDTKIIKKYDSLELAKESEYYKDFQIMKKMIEENIFEREKELKTNKKDIFKWETLTGGVNADYSGADYEWICKKTKEFVQLHVDLNKDEWILTTSKEKLGHLKYWFEDFDEIDKNELHLLTYHDELDVKNLDKSSPYYEIVKEAKVDLGLIGGIIPGKIKFEEIDFMEFKKTISHYSIEEKDFQIFYRARIKIDRSGNITKTITLENGKKIKKIHKKELDPVVVEKCFKEIANFLSEGILRKSLFIDNSVGTLIIHFKDGHSEKYDRGLARKKIHLRDLLTDVIYCFENEDSK